MQYLAKFTEDGDGLIVTFPDIPEAMTNGRDRAEARSNAAEALELAVLGYYAQRRPLPVALKRPAGGGSYELIGVPVGALAKVAFIDAFKASGQTRVALAAKLGKDEGEVRRMLNPLHATKIQAIEAGLRELGKRMVLQVEDAA